MDACGRRIVKASYRAILRRCDNDLKRHSNVIVRGDASRLSDLDSLRHFFAPEQVVQHLRNVCPATVASLGQDSPIFQTLLSSSSSSSRHEDPVQTRIVNAVDIKRTTRLIFHCPTLLVQNAQSQSQSDLDVLVDESPRAIRFVDDYLRAKRQHSLFLQWLLLLSRDHSNLEDGAVLISAVAQPQKSVNEIHSKVTETLNDIADAVRVKLASKTLPLSESDSNEHGEPESTQTALSAANQVLFEEMEFLGTMQQNRFSLENSLIDRVLHTRSGVPIALSMIYMAICERIGVRINAVNFPYHFMLKWHPSKDSEDGTTKCYIDVLNRGLFVSQNECKVTLQQKGVHPKREHFQLVRPPLIYARMLRNIISMASSHPRPADYASVASPEYVFMHMLAAAVPNPSSHYIIEEEHQPQQVEEAQTKSSAHSRV